MGHINIHFHVQLREERLKTFNFMLKFKSLNKEFDVEDELSTILEKEAKKSSTLKFNWNFTTQCENALEIILDRLNFFIKSGKITVIQKKEIKEIFFENETYTTKLVTYLNGDITYRKGSVSWTLNNYFVLKYHLLNILITNLSNANELDLNMISFECAIDKKLLINLISAFINKTLLEFTSEGENSIIRLTSNVQEKIDELQNLLAEMEFNLAS
jgi:hypothetical protein